MALIHFCLLIFAALTIMFFDRAHTKWENYFTGKGGVKWRYLCDFPGYDVGRKEIIQEKCSQICLATSDSNGCNAFSWQNGWCYLKKIPAHSLSRKRTISGRCGVLPWKFENNEDVESVEEGDDSDGNGITWIPDLSDLPDLVEKGGCWGDRGPNGVEDDVIEQPPQMKCA